MKTLIYFLFLLPVGLTAQYSNISLIDQLSLEMAHRDANESVLLAGRVADASQLDDKAKATFLERSISAIPFNRYDTYSGSPYYFDSFVDATLRDLTGSTFPLPTINYNAHSGRLEHKSGNNWVELGPAYFPNVVFADKDNKTHYLIFGLIPDHRLFYSELIYKGETLQAATHRKIFTFENDTYDAGPVNTRFAAKDLLYINVDGKWEPAPAKTKAFVTMMGHPRMVTAFMREHKLKANKQEDLVRILEYVETLKE